MGSNTSTPQKDKEIPSTNTTPIVKTTTKNAATPEAALLVCDLIRESEPPFKV